MVDLGNILENTFGSLKNIPKDTLKNHIMLIFFAIM